MKTPKHGVMVSAILALAFLAPAQAASDRIQVVVRKSSIEHVLNTLAATGGFNQGGSAYSVGYSVRISDFTLETSPADQKLYVNLIMKIDTDFDFIGFDWGPQYTYRVRVAAGLEEAPATTPTGKGLTMCFRPDALRETYCQNGGSWIKCAAAAVIDGVIGDALQGMSCVNLAGLGVALPDLDRSWLSTDLAPRIETDRLTFGYTIRPKRNRACLPCINLLLD